MKPGSKILNRSLPVKPRRPSAPARRSLAATLHQGMEEGGADMGYIIAWLLGVPVTLLVLFWLFFGR
jgi:hypothetical protein